MLNRIIAEYTKEHKRLVLPGFGAFIRKETGEVVLVEFLKKDDGVLVSLIIGQNGGGEQQALETIEQYVAKIKRNIAQSGEYRIEGLGRIYVTGNGLYELEYLGGGAMEESDLSAPSENNRPPTAEAMPAMAEAAPERTEAPAAGATQSVPAQTAANVKPESVVATAATREPVKPQSQPAAQPRPAYNPVQPKTQPTPQRPAYRPAYTQPQKKKSDMVMVIAILAALFALAVIGFSFWVGGGPASQIVPTNQPVEQTAGE